MNSNSSQRSVSYLLLFCALIPPATTFAGKFDQVRNEVQQDKPAKKKKKKHRNRNDCRNDDDDRDWFDEVISDMISGIFSISLNRRGKVRDIRYEFKNDPCQFDPSYRDPVYANQPNRLPPDWQNHQAYGQDSASIPIQSYPAESPPVMTFAEFPYAGGWQGYMMYSNWEVPVLKKTSGRISFEYGSDFDDIDRWTGDFQFEGARGWGIDADWNYYTERLAPGLQDNLHLGDINVFYRAVQTEKLQWRFGLGINWLDTRDVGEMGLNGTLKLDWFPVKPIVFSGELDYGRLGDAEMFHGGFSLGVMMNRVELFSGYDYRKIGQVELEGPVFGIRLWW